MFKRIDHVVIAVTDLEASADLYANAFSLKGTPPKEVPAIGIRNVLFDVGNAFIELAQPLNDTGPIARFLKERGEGLYLIAIQVDDLKASARRLREKGARILGDENAGGQVFIHPKSTHGVLIQLLQ